MLYNKSLYVEGLVSYVLDTKPYHSKISETILQYDFYDSVNVKITDDIFSKVKLGSIWEMPYAADGQRRRFLTPSYNLPRYSLESNRHRYTLSDKADYLLSTLNLDDCYQLRAARGLESVVVNGTESLAEGLDYFVSKGMLSIQLNAPNVSVRTWEEIHNQVPFEGSLIYQVNPENPIVIENVDFPPNAIEFDTWTVEHTTYRFDTSDEWLIDHQLNSTDIVWQIYIETSGNHYEAIIASNVTVVDANHLHIQLSAPYAGKVVIARTKADQVFQQVTPSATWVISHNLNSTDIFAQPLIEVSSGVFEYLIPTSLEILNANQIEITFTNPQHGKVFVHALNHRYDVVTPASSWTITGGDFSEAKTSLFSTFVDNGTSIEQVYPTSVSIDDTSMTCYFATPVKGYVSYGYGYGYGYFSVTSEKHGFLGYTTVQSTVLATITPAYPDQVDFYVPHDLDSVSVKVDGLSVPFTSVTPGHIQLHSPVQPADNVVVIEQVINRFENEHISFDVIGGTGLAAQIRLREDGFIIHPDAPEEKWTLVKINPISYRQLVHEYVGLAQVQIRAIKDIPVPLGNFDWSLPEYAYLRHQYKIEVLSLTGPTYQVTDLSTGVSYAPGVSNTFNVVDGADILFQITVATGIRPIHVGDYAFFRFGYDVEPYEFDNSYDNGITSVPYFGTRVQLHPKTETIKLLPLGSAYSKAVTEVIRLIFDAEGQYFTVEGSVTGNHPIAFLGQEYDNGYVRFRLVSSSELFSISDMVKDPRGYKIGYTQRSIDNLDLIDGDTFHFEILSERPSYLVHGSLTGYTKPAVVGQYYWNGKIGFQLDAPKYHVQEAVSKGQIVNQTGSVTLTNGSSITFTLPPRLDAAYERLDFVFHPEIDDITLRDPYDQFLVYSSLRGQLPSAPLGELYEVFDAECAERGTERANIVSLIIGNEAPFVDNQKFTIEVIPNQLRMVHDQDILILDETRYHSISSLQVNSYQEDLLTLEFKTNHPELGSYDELVPTYLVASDDYNTSLGYDGHMLRLGYDLLGNSLTPLNYTQPTTLIDSSGHLIFNSFNEENLYNDTTQYGTFAFEPYDEFIGYGTANDGSFPNRPHRQSPNMPDRGYIFDVFLSNVAYQDESKHNKVGTITWQYDPDAKFFRQVIDFTPLFASKYLKLNTQFNIKVAQADEYNDLTRILISEQLKFRSPNIGTISSVWADLIELGILDHLGSNVVQSKPAVTDDQAAFEAATAINDFSVNFTSTFEPEGIEGYDMPVYPTSLPYDHLGYDVGTFTYNLSEEGSDGNQLYTFWGYDENPWATDFFMQIPAVQPSDIGPWKVVPYVYRAFETPVQQLVVELAGGETVLQLYYTPLTTGHQSVLGTLMVEGVDYGKTDVTPINVANGHKMYKFIIRNPRPFKILVSNT